MEQKGPRPIIFDATDKNSLQGMFGFFQSLYEQPSKAKLYQGMIFLGMKKYDQDPRPSYAIDEILDVYDVTLRAFPYLPYFLRTERKLGQLANCFCAKARIRYDSCFRRY
ncbi:MAG TPA: hypothetical protein DCE41_09950 [Cytophagales bacterium]|nr:hypothetical protein [Cytophagales bacterium]HAP64762.1 hypothetical protein [Cytophagales bacterium]